MVKKNNEEKEIKYKIFDLKKLQKAEFGVCIFVGIVFLVLLACSVVNEIFIPSVFISFALFLFCICYYYIEDKKKKKLVYVLFSIGVLLIVIEVIYTLCKIC